MKKCEDCGYVFEDGEERTYRENHMEGGYYEQFSECPYCGGDYREATMCESCCKYFFSEELHGGICNECLHDYDYDVKTCIKVGADAVESVEINSFLAFALTEDQINDILSAALIEADKIVRCNASKYIDNDADWFAERLTMLQD